MMIVAFDASMANVAYVVYDPVGQEVVVSATYRSPGSMNSIEGYLTGVSDVYRWVHDQLAALDLTADDIIVHEQPVTGPARRPESSLLASAAVRIAARDRGLTCEGVSAQKARRLVLGLPNPSKALIREWLSDKYPEDLRGRLANEHLRDALIVAMGYAVMAVPAQSIAADVA